MGPMLCTDKWVKKMSPAVESSTWLLNSHSCLDNYTKTKNENMLYFPLSWKVTFPVTSEPTPPIVFNLRASDWVHCEEETGAYTQLSWNTYKLARIILNFFKVYFSPPQNTCISKKSVKFIIHFVFQKKIIGHTYKFTKCIDNLKFSASLKSYQEQAFP